jgi:SAM-dependent methyltransferase
VPAPDEAATNVESATDRRLPTVNAGQLYGRWYYDSYTVRYDENEHWTTFFGQVADAILEQLAPRTVLDAGCAKGFLVAALRERGVDASGFDISGVAIDNAPEAAKPYVRVGSLTDPIDGRYDLVTCVEVIEHLDPTDATQAVTHLTGASDHILLSSTPGDHHEPTHVNVQPPERWSQLFATRGFFRDFRHDAAYLSPWAALYRREDRSTPEVVFEYDRAWSQLRRETIEQRRGLLDLQDRLEQLERKADREGPERPDEESLRKELLRVRDQVVGKDAELAVALGRVAELESFVERYANLEARLDAVLRSRSWRLMWAVGTPVRRLRQRGG